MARSQLTSTSNDLTSDSGGVLWSFVQGEQLEFPVLLNFVEDATTFGYQYEAVVVEALNIALSGDRPTTIKPGGVQTKLVVRIPTNRGTWQAVQAYNQEEVVKYGIKYYKLLSGAARVNSTTPDLDPLWFETTLNKVYIQFPKTLGATWSVQPAIGSNTYGFFELRVTEPTNSVFTKTWKPVRGMVEVQFSPTELVPDV
jgi:hypothetical protein